MSLQIWLPLDGSLENNGIADVTITNNGASVVTDGKVGSCYSFNGSSYIHISKPSNMTTIKNTSVCAFVKSTGSTLALGGISHDQDAASADTASMTLFTSGWQFIGSSVYKYAPGGSIANTSVWHHVCCVMTNTNIITYLDGKEFSNVTISSVGVDQFNLTANTFIEIGCDHPGGNEFLTGLVKDFRVYDHVLTDIEVKEISDTYAPLTLICHLPLDKTDGGFTVYDESGYDNNGTLSTNRPIITSGAPGKYSSSMLFNGTDNFIMLGRGPMVTGTKLTVNVWAYMSNWSTYASGSGMRIASCTEGGGWNFEQSGDKIRFLIGTGASANTYQPALPSQSLASLSGWVMFTGTYDGKDVKIYINGEPSGITAAYTTETPIYYNTSNGIFIGAEAGTNVTTPDGSYFNGKISDFRIYASALSEEEIFELYNITNHPDLDSIVFTDTDSFTDISELYVKEIHLHELQNAITKLNSYLPNVDNCGYVNCCESCQDSCICQSDKCQSCQNTCTCQSDKCQKCQNTCTNCTSKNQGCQNTCINCTNCSNQKCQNTCICQW